MLVWYPATENKLVVTRCWDCQESQAAILSVTLRGTVDTCHGAWHAERHIRMNKCKGVRKQLCTWAAGGPGFPVPRALRCLTLSWTLPTSLPGRHQGGSHVPACRRRFCQRIIPFPRRKEGQKYPAALQDNVNVVFGLWCFSGRFPII